MDTAFYDGWEYSLAINEANTEIDLRISGQERQTPNELVKYYALSNYSIDAFTKGKFYASQPTQLNDLFDGHLRSIDFYGMPEKQILAVREMIGDPENLYMNDRQKFWRLFSNQMLLEWSRQFGVLSTTPNLNSDLMWAHYANNQGFAVVFNSMALGAKFLGPFPVKYQQKRTTIKVSDSLPPNLTLFIAALLKKSIWNYEEEFRYIVRPDMKENFRLEYPWNHADTDKGAEQSRLVSYNPNAIQRVILGFNFHARFIKDRHQQTIDLSSNEAQFHRTLIEHLNRKNIPIEIITMNLGSYELTPKPISFQPLDEHGLYKAMIQIE